MTFSDQCWAASAQIRERIDNLPLLQELADGTLNTQRFVEYIAQDDFYLRGYARALAMLATRAPDSQAAAFWATSAGEAVAAETQMHDALLNDPLLASADKPKVASPTTRGYVNMLQTMVAYEPYPIGVAAVLPCYWVYAEVGAKLAQQAALVTGHPYAAWVAAYADPAFQQTTATAIKLLNQAAEQTDEATRAAMLTAFVDATYFEEQFWAKAYQLEAWPV